MTVVTIPDPLHAGRFAVAVSTAAGTNVVGVGSGQNDFPNRSSCNLSKDDADELAADWQDALDQQAGKKIKRVRKRKESKVVLKQWD